MMKRADRLSLATKILAMLKEQESTINELQNAYSYLQKQYFEAQEKLLKEHEAVEPKTGHWIYKKYDDMFMCSSCEKYSIRNDYPYCHWCGAKMKQEGR